MENSSPKFLLTHQYPVILVHGKNNVGKTAFVKKSLGNKDYVYFEIVENTSSIYTIANSCKADVAGMNINLDASVLQMFDRMINIEKKIVIFDNIEKMDKDGLSIFFNISMKALHSMSGGGSLAFTTIRALKMI